MIYTRYETYIIYTLLYIDVDLEIQPQGQKSIFTI